MNHLTDEGVLREWTTKQLDLKVRRVCEDCNTGWMHDLEEDCRPLLTNMIQGVDLPITLDQEQQALLALWATKTAMMVDFLDSGPQHVPATHYRWVYERREPPPQALVRLGGYALEIPASGSISAIQSAPDRLYIRPPLLAAPMSPDGLKAYTMTMRVGYLVIQLFGHGLDGQNLEIMLDPKELNYFLVLWPRDTTLPKVQWPVGDMPWAFMDDEGFAAFAMIFRTEDPPIE